ncbi:hypothetical protein FZW96_00745 [Bacillus sp. BGMRC 2118]|nr:hypothetical protein FZW96_00745 [Bacillus sp. BGMRC 2118]
MTKFYELTYGLLEPLLPKKFDENEWFTIAITILVLSISVYLQKKQPILLQTELIGVLLINLLYTTVGDYFLAIPPYDFYDTVDHNSGEFMDILLQNIVYPFSLLIMMYFYVKYKPNKLFYTLLCAVILFVLEWISIKYFHLFTLKSWKSWYSLFFYTPVVWINIIFYEKLHQYIIMKINQKG